MVKPRKKPPFRGESDWATSRVAKLSSNPLGSILTEVLSRLRHRAKPKKDSHLQASLDRGGDKEPSVQSRIGTYDIETHNHSTPAKCLLIPACRSVHTDNQRRDSFGWRNPYSERNRQADTDHMTAFEHQIKIDDSHGTARKTLE
ncbi:MULTISPECIES: hypothetical protein [Acidithrix]|uniref:hypothetical protein n=1 Tax=Acidithrix TaxID=1609233 RepID=UPI000698E4A4|nr:MULTISPECIES: hypothetical protein [Acidithrix]